MKHCTRSLWVSCIMSASFKDSFGNNSWNRKSLLFNSDRSGVFSLERQAWSKPGLDYSTGPTFVVLMLKTTRAVLRHGFLKIVWRSWKCLPGTVVGLIPRVRNEIPLQQLRELLESWLSMRCCQTWEALSPLVGSLAEQLYPPRPCT